jgi:hypothetical protein
MRTYHPNGLLIQSVLPPESNEGEQRLFRGIGAFPAWPLEPFLDEEANATIRRCDKWFLRFTPEGRMAMHVIPDVVLAGRYAQVCLEQGVVPRVILCYTPENDPYFSQGNELRLRSRFIGFDFASRFCDFSLVDDDLFGEEILALQECRKSLNESGLFSKEDEFEHYLFVRRGIVGHSDRCLESDVDCCPFQLFDVSNVLLQSFPS